MFLGVLLSSAAALVAMLNKCYHIMSCVNFSKLRNNSFAQQTMSKEPALASGKRDLPPSY